jgi:hypothetical protein
LATAARCALCNIYHLERVHHLLDQPAGYGLRREYLGIELTREEEIAYDRERRMSDRKWVETQLAEHREDVRKIVDTLRDTVAEALRAFEQARPKD